MKSKKCLQYLATIRMKFQRKKDKVIGEFCTKFHLKTPGLSERVFSCEKGMENGHCLNKVDIDLCKISVLIMLLLVSQQ